jgi:hypothetical protein
MRGTELADWTRVNYFDQEVFRLNFCSELDNSDVNWGEKLRIRAGTTMTGKLCTV